MAQQQHSGQGCAIFGAGAGAGNFGDLLNAGGGGEVFVWRGLTAGGDLAYMWPRVEPSAGIGLLSVGPAWHFVNQVHPRKVVPFVNGGYGLAFRNGAANLWYWGGGFSWWFASHVGMRVEFRHYGQQSYGFDNAIRFGIAFH